MTTARSTTRRQPPNSFVLWFLGLTGIAVTIIFSGVGMAALLASRGGAADWSKWSDVGQTFGALGSIISGLTLVALVVTARMQFREMQENRHELEQHRRSLNENHLELQRTATANLGMLHLEILKLAIAHPDLAEVWPAFEPKPSADLNRKYLYANVIYQFQFRSLQGGSYPQSQVIANLRYLFTSQLMRDYWKAASPARRGLPSESEEYAFAQLVDEVCREFDLVASPANHRSPAAGPTTLSPWSATEQAA